METTLILDEDVATALERLRSSRDQPLDVLDNEALRRGLRLMTIRLPTTQPVEMKTSLGAIWK